VSLHARQPHPGRCVPCGGLFFSFLPRRVLLAACARRRGSAVQRRVGVERRRRAWARCGGFSFFGALFAHARQADDVVIEEACFNNTHDLQWLEVGENATIRSLTVAATSRFDVSNATARLCCAPSIRAAAHLRVLGPCVGGGALGLFSFVQGSSIECDTVALAATSYVAGTGMFVAATSIEIEGNLWLGKALARTRWRPPALRRALVFGSRYCSARSPDCFERRWPTGALCRSSEQHVVRCGGRLGQRCHH
jgi:hypothetical protein